MLIAILVFLILNAWFTRRIASNQIVLHRQMVENASAIVKALRLNREAAKH